MRAQLLEEIKKPLVLREVPQPEPQEHELLLRVLACGVCRTDQHLADGEIATPKLPLILGHQIVGKVEKLGPKADHRLLGKRVGVAWLHHSCGKCAYCTSGRENLCDQILCTGRDRMGGFAEYTVAHEQFVYPLPENAEPTQLAPLLCSGAIGYRAWDRVRKAKRLGLYGFGSSAQIVAQMALHAKSEVYAFTRHAEQYAKECGCTWVGTPDDKPPHLFDAAILFAPVGSLVPRALSHLAKGGHLVCAEIHMSDIPSFPYSLLWEERTLSSVANVTRTDVFGLLALAPFNIKTNVFSFEDANNALNALRHGKVTGSVVLKV